MKLKTQKPLFRFFSVYRPKPKNTEEELLQMFDVLISKMPPNEKKEIYKRLKNNEL